MMKKQANFVCFSFVEVILQKKILFALMFQKKVFLK